MYGDGDGDGDEHDYGDGDDSNDRFPPSIIDVCLPLFLGYGFTPPSPRMPRYPSNERLSGSHSSANSSPPTHTVQVVFY